MSERTMPILGGRKRFVYELPWVLFAGHEPQALMNHGQSLDRLAERGGLDLSEALAIIEDRPWVRIPEADAYDRILAKMVAKQAESP